MFIYKFFNINNDPANPDISKNNITLNIDDYNI
jgi:hypothetical protein